VSYIRRRLAPKPIKIRADIEVTCFAYEGIEAIKGALQAGLDTPTNSEVEIKLIAPPMYVRNVWSCLVLACLVDPLCLSPWVDLCVSWADARLGGRADD
jgi:hypothetical protein